MEYTREGKHSVSERPSLEFDWYRLGVPAWESEWAPLGNCKNFMSGTHFLWPGYVVMSAVSSNALVCFYAIVVVMVNCQRLLTLLLA